MLAILIADGAKRANAETIGHSMLRTCPNRAALASANQRATAADAANDPDRYALHRAVARELDQCSRTNADPRYREVATLASIATMLGSLNLRSMKNVSDLKDRAGKVRGWEKTASDLAVTTRYPDVRGAATMLRTSLAAMLSKMDAEIARLEPGKKP